MKILTHLIAFLALAVPAMAASYPTPTFQGLNGMPIVPPPLNGVSDDSANMQAARSQITTGGRIMVPPGKMNIVTPPTRPANSTAIWDIQASNSAGSFNAYQTAFGTDFVHATNGGEWWYQLATSATSGNGTAPIMRLDRNVTHTGGSGWSLFQINDTQTAGSAPGDQMTSMSVLATLNATAATSPYVGFYQYAKRGLGGNTPIYGANFEIEDATGGPQNLAHIGAEWDILGNGTWTSEQAGILDLVLKRSNAFPSGTLFHANFAIRVDNSYGSLAEGGFDHVFYASTTNVYKAAFDGHPTLATGAVFFDASAGIYTDAIPIALRLGANNAIDFSGASTNRLRYVTGLLNYDVSGLSRLSITDAGLTTLFAATINNSSSNIALNIASTSQVGIDLSGTFSLAALRTTLGQKVCFDVTPALCVNEQVIAGVNTLVATGAYGVSGATSGPGSGVGTLTNAPAAGNPQTWIPFSFNGTIHWIPAWHL